MNTNNKNECKHETFSIYSISRNSIETEFLDVSVICETCQAHGKDHIEVMPDWD